MPDEARLILAFALALGAAFAATPVAIAVATRTGFQDKPLGYKGHKAPTPYLGGAAVVAAFVLAGLTVGGELSRLSPIVVCAFGMWCLGTLDDRIALSPSLRLTLEFALASALWTFGLGWSVFDAAVPDLILTNLWVVGLANAFNLMDNMDGAAATVGAVSSMATAVLALIGGDVALAVICIGMSGACAGFLPYNLAGPARIFLGDGGSLPIGFVVATGIMALPDHGDLGWTRLLAAVILAGLPVVDTALVMISRRRAGIPLLTGGRDHLTHRLATRLRSPRRVALALGCTQALLGAVAIGVVQLGEGLVVSAWATWFVAATAAVILLETATWAPAREPLPEADPPPPGTRAAGPDAPPERDSPSWVEGGVIVFITVACGLSPALYGFYSLSVWGPIALFLLAALLGLVIARPASPRPAALLAVGGLAALWLWSLASTGWSESADQALIDANRWLLYAALFAILVLLLRNDRLGRLLLGSATLAVVAFGAYLGVRLLGPDGGSMFISKRLHEPLGYVNGQAGYLLLALWPLVAVAERARNHLLAGGAIAAATGLVGLAVLGQTRAVVPALVVSAVVLVVALPGRGARLWALVAVAVGVAVAAGPLLDVFDSGGASATPDAQTVRTAVLALLGVSMVVGAMWAGLRWLAERSSERVGADRLAMASTAGLLVLAVVVGVAGLAAVGNPVERVREEARSFKNLGAGSDAQSRSRFTSGAGNRYDYWRVAADQFESEPVKGLGAGNYDRTYFLERGTSEDIRQPHSLPLQTLAELGLVGGAALLLFLGAIVAGFVRRARRARTSAGDLGLAVGGGGMFLVWLVHTSVDWLHLIPGVTGIALCGAAVLVAPWTRSRAPEGGRSVLRLATIVVCGLVVLVGATLVGRAALADKYRSDSQETVAEDPSRALEEAGDSLALNDESLPAYYAKAAALARLDDYGGARAALLEATRREPHDFVTWALLGDLAVRRGDLAQARRDYGRASELNPRGPGLESLAKNPRAGLAQ